MGILLIIAGLFILGITLLDVVWTAFWVDEGEGPITDFMAGSAWKILKRLDDGKGKVLGFSGPLILFLTLITWVMLLWIGWTIFFTGTGGVTRSTGNDPLQWFDYFYYSAYVMFTLGNGEFTPESGAVKIMTGISAGLGMMFLTLGISYILSIVGAVINKRAFAGSVMGVSESAEDMLIKGWNGENFNDLDPYLSDLAFSLGTINQQHKAYPLLFYFYTKDTRHSLIRSVALMDNLVSFFEIGLKEDIPINRITVHNLRSALNDYLDTSESYLRSKGSVPIEAPDLLMLQQAGIPVVPHDKFNEKMAEHEERRKKIKGLLNEDSGG